MSPILKTTRAYKILVLKEDGLLHNVSDNQIWLDETSYPADNQFECFELFREKEDAQNLIRDKGQKYEKLIIVETSFTGEVLEYEKVVHVKNSKLEKIYVEDSTLVAILQKSYHLTDIYYKDKKISGPLSDGLGRVFI